MDWRGFRTVDLAATHPGGKLAVWYSKDQCSRSAVCCPGYADVSGGGGDGGEGRLGLALVGTVDDLRGIITDGDLRRTLLETLIQPAGQQNRMNPAPQTISADALYGQAEEMMLGTTQVRSWSQAISTSTALFEPLTIKKYSSMSDQPRRWLT